MPKLNGLYFRIFIFSNFYFFRISNCSTTIYENWRAALYQANVLHKIGHSERIIEANCTKMILLYLVYPVVFFRCVSLTVFLFFVNSINDKGVNTALRSISYSYPSPMIYFTHHSLRISNIFHGMYFPRGLQSPNGQRPLKLRRAY